MRKSFKNFVVGSLAVLFLAGCDQMNASDDSRNRGAEEQENIMQRAIDAEPTYQPNNFLTREYVNEYMRRMDDPNKVFYIYLLGDNGNMIGYYVGTRPVSVCTLLTPPDKLHHVSGSHGRAMAVTRSPQLDGVYSTGGCDSYFFFDNSTDALLEINGTKFVVVDKPLNVEAEAITVQSDSE